MDHLEPPCHLRGQGLRPIFLLSPRLAGWALSIQTHLHPCRRSHGMTAIIPGLGGSLGGCKLSRLDGSLV